MRLEVVAFVNVALVAVRSVIKAAVADRNAVKNDPVDVALVKVADTAVRKEAKALVLVLLVVELLVAKKLVAVAFPAVRAVIVVVARVEVPSTVSRPEVVALPFPSTVKLRFSVHADPFQ
jgi:hypothetical protein